MKRAGIKVWVLTGDKIETAMNIGVSAGLLDSSMAQYVIEESEYDQLKLQLNTTLKKIENPSNSHVKQAIIVAGASLVVIDKHDELRSTFL